MAKKRKSGGRRKGQSGRGKSVQCAKCGRKVPIDKAKKKTKRISIVDRDTEQMIRRDGGFVPTTFRTQYYCISCAVHTRQVHIRSKRDRDTARPQAEQKTATKKLTDDRIRERMITEQRREHQREEKQRAKQKRKAVRDTN